MKLNTPGVCLTGFLIIIEMPSDMNGLLKSITRSRSAVIVMAAIAISASCSNARGALLLLLLLPPTPPLFPPPMPFPLPPDELPPIKLLPIPPPSMPLLVSPVVFADVEAAAIASSIEKEGKCIYETIILKLIDTKFSKETTMNENVHENINTKYETVWKVFVTSDYPYVTTIEA
ncbi:hypothetical protein GQX74_003538 [Glossina fuscipes]|nr:hypothetical protein GQX74_003538 [Glossina fuscipes]